MTQLPKISVNVRSLFSDGRMLVPKHPSTCKMLLLTWVLTWCQKIKIDLSPCDILTHLQLFILGKSYAKPGNKVIVTSGELERSNLNILSNNVLHHRHHHDPDNEGHWCSHEGRKCPVEVLHLAKLLSAIRLDCSGGNHFYGNLGGENDPVGKESSLKMIMIMVIKMTTLVKMIMMAMG